MKDLAKLYQTTEGAVVQLVYGRVGAPGRNPVKPSLDPSYLDRVCDLREKKRWEECQGETPLSTLRTYLAQHKPEYVSVLESLQHVG